jgi:hypothetical protein
VCSRHLGLWPRFGSRLRRPEHLILPCRAAFIIAPINLTGKAQTWKVAADDSGRMVGIRSVVPEIGATEKLKWRVGNR